ncbi:MAG: hypothetical protein ACRDOE_14925 [Streptosporangiaceae bacterium]
MAVTQVLENRAAGHEPERSQAQCDDLAGQARLGGHGAHQPVVFGLPVSVDVGVLEHAARDPVCRRAQMRRHSHAQLGLLHQQRVLVRMDEHAFPPKLFYWSAATIRPPQD